jgi:hypothetical protein
VGTVGLTVGGTDVAMLLAAVRAAVGGTGVAVSVGAAGVAVGGRSAVVLVGADATAVSIAVGTGGTTVDGGEDSHENEHGYLTITFGHFSLIILITRLTAQEQHPHSLFHLES